MIKQPYSVLVVDDDESIRYSIAAVLELEGYDVDTAENGKEALQKTEKRTYDVALIDFRLPDFAGTDLLEMFKPSTPPMLRFIVTGFPSMQNAIDSVNNGADAYVQKPVDTEKLLETIAKHLKKREEDKKYSELKVVEYIETRAKAFEKTMAKKAASEKPGNKNGLR